MSLRISRRVRCLFVGWIVAFASGTAWAQWPTINPGTDAPIRFISKSNGRLIGGRVAEKPNIVESLVSTDDGATWTRSGTVATAPAAVICGDVCIASDGGSLVYCAFRQQYKLRWEVTVCRSTDSGATWAFDSVVATSGNGQFVGAPFLRFARDGNLQCYYDSEPAATAAGHPGQGYVAMTSKGKLAFGAPWDGYAGVACRPAGDRTFARHGMASVVALAGREVMLVCEGVDDANPTRNSLFAIMSHDDGKTWDLATRQQIYRPVVRGIQFNAYCPQAIRVGNGPVGVVFCTDEDFPAPSVDSDPIPPAKRPRQVHPDSRQLPDLEPSRAGRGSGAAHVRPRPLRSCEQRPDRDHRLRPRPAGHQAPLIGAERSARQRRPTHGRRTDVPTPGGRRPRRRRWPRRSAQPPLAGG